MVIKWREAIITSRRLTPRARLVALVLAMRMSKDGECWPSVATIAKDAGCSEMTVHRAIKELRQHGYLWVTFRGKGPFKQQTNLYAAKIPEWRKDVSLKHMAPDEIQF